MATVKEKRAQLKQFNQLRKLASQIQTPQQLALYLSQIGSDKMRQAVYERIKPLLNRNVQAALRAQSYQESISEQVMDAVLEDPNLKAKFVG